MEESLSMVLVQRISIIAVVAYVFSNTKAFRLTFKEHTTLSEKAVLILFFSTVSIVGTYWGIPIEDALANVRDTGSIVAGLLGGSLIGGATGLISGLHRASLGGFTAIPCGISTFLGGLIAGYIYEKVRPKMPGWGIGIATGVGVILFSMALILTFSKPFPAAKSLVMQITLPMSLANAAGIAVFLLIVHNARENQTKIAALQTHKALHIANTALPYFRQGLNIVSAEKVATAILNTTSASAVAITNQDQVLAHVGIGSDHHTPGGLLQTDATKSCLITGQVKVAQNAKEIGCTQQEGCPLKSAVIAPLFCQNEVVGTLKIYYAREEALTELDIEFIQGLAQIFSTQLELANLQQMAEFAAKAELKALQAQINPHFLFNALNTIVSLCRTNPEEARNLIIQLSDFFRRNLKMSHDFVTLEEEIQHVDSYLTLEKARFGERLIIIKDIDDSVMNLPVPTFILQPIVENAVKHGLLARRNGGTVRIAVRKNNNEINIVVSDNGQGIPSEILTQVLQTGFGKGAGIGLSNVNERLKVIYGPKYALEIDSVEGEGTTIAIRIPIINESANILDNSTLKNVAL